MCMYTLAKLEMGTLVHLQERRAKRMAMSTAGCPPFIAHEVI